MRLVSTLVGTIVDARYRVERVIGQGGMGVVVAARHLRLGHLVAIKFPLSMTSVRHESVERLLREARATMHIRSDHVAKIHDAGLHEDAGPYLVMEYLVGRDLGTALAQDGPIPAKLAAEYILQVTEPLAEAHAKGIVHRDLKPSNLFLSQRVDGSPFVKVIDFGLAKTLRVEDQIALTRSGAMLGSPLFVAPEQMRGAATVDARADIWALGASLYALLTGKPPFPGKNLLDVHDRIKLGPPEIIAAIADIEPALEHVLLRCLRRDPAERYASVVDVAGALARAIPGPAAKYAEQVRRTFEISSATAEGEVAVVAPVKPDGTSMATAHSLTASWLEAPSTRQRVETGMPLSLSSEVDVPFVQPKRGLLAVIAAVSLLLAGGLNRHVGERASVTEKMSTTGRGPALAIAAASARLAAKKLPSRASAFSESSQQLLPPSMGVLPQIVEARATAAMRRQRLAKATSVRVASPTRDPLVDPD